LHGFSLCAWNLATFERSEAGGVRALAISAHPAAAVVETCQRVEAYTWGPGCTCQADRRLQGFDAVLHLAAVAAGLESAVLGEAQVLGQVRAGLETIHGGRRLVVDVAIAAARQLRAEAGFDATTGHLLDHALPLAGLPSRGDVLVIGAGAAGALVARRARDLGFRTVAIASRRPVNPPARFGADHWFDLAAMAGAGPFDVAVACLGSNAPELHGRDLPAARAYIDLGTPPNICRQVSRVVRLADILAAQGDNPAEARHRARLRGRLREILAARLAMAGERSDTPIGRIRSEVERVRQREAERIARLHPGLSHEAIESITRGLVNQIFHLPSERLRAMGDTELGERLADLFTTTEGAP
jgi:glutamyl-tRNA reductase